MLYCSNCMKICESGACEGCGKPARKLKEVQPHDPVFLCETAFLTAGVIASALKDAGIPFFKRNDGGAAVSVIIGNACESDRIYVPYSAYYESKNIADGILSQISDRDFEDDIGDEWRIAEENGEFEEDDELGEDEDDEEDDEEEEDV